MQSQTFRSHMTKLEDNYMEHFRICPAEISEMSASEVEKEKNETLEKLPD